MGQRKREKWKNDPPFVEGEKMLPQMTRQCLCELPKALPSSQLEGGRKASPKDWPNGR